jgi:hypothetical protein
MEITLWGLRELRFVRRSKRIVKCFISCVKRISRPGLVQISMIDAVHENAESG